MTTLYRPVLIESAEQAEALPVGTLATRFDQTRARQILTRIDSRLGPWEMDLRGYRHELLIGFTALVPTEAEEEWTVGRDDPAWAPGTESWAREFQAQVPGRRLFCRATTPWEEA